MFSYGREQEIKEMMSLLLNLRNLYPSNYGELAKINLKRKCTYLRASKSKNLNSKYPFFFQHIN